MSAAWSRLSRSQQRTWGAIAGALVAGTVVKVGYFKFSRGVMVNDTSRQHQEALSQLREAEEYAKWSKKDREERLPPLTPEQREQMRDFLKIVDQNGFSKEFADTESDMVRVLHGKKAQSVSSD